MGEMLLLLLHLLFTCPVEPKPDYLETLMQMLIERRLAEDRSPQMIYAKRCEYINTMDHPFYKSPQLERIKKLDFKTACDCFNAKLCSPKQWTFVLTGKLPATKEVVALLQKYVGTIPERELPPPSSHPTVQAMAKAHTCETVAALNVKFPTAAVPWEEVKVAMVDPQCKVLITAHLKLEMNTEEESFKEAAQVMALSHLWQVLESKLNERLRFNLGKTYRVSIGDSFSVSPPHPGVPKTGTVSISFCCDPSDAKELSAQVMAELGKFREDGFEDKDIASIKEQERRQFEKLVRENSFWETTLINLYFSKGFQSAANGKDIAKALNNWRLTYNNATSLFTAESAKALLLKSLPEDLVHTKIVMVPQAPSNGACTLM